MSVPKVKGSSVVLAVKSLRAVREAALRVLPPDLHHYLDERVLVSSWYPERDLLGLLKAMVSLIPSPAQDPWYLNGLLAAQLHATETYRHLFESRDVERILQHVNIPWRAQHDTGTFTCEMLGPGQARLSLADYGVTSREFCTLLSGYVVGLVRAAGGLDAAVRKLRCRSDGAPTCDWEVSWRKEQPPTAAGGRRDPQ